MSTPIDRASLQSFIMGGELPTIAGGDGINAPDAPPTPTPTDAQVAEAAEHLAMTDRELNTKAPDHYIEGILRRLGLPVNAPTLEAVKAAARDGAPAEAPAAEPAEEAAPAEAPAPDPAEVAALAISEAMRTARPPVLILSAKKAKLAARAATDWRSISAKRWSTVVSAAVAASLWVVKGKAGPEAFGVEVDPIEVQSLTGPDLGYTPTQVARMLPAERLRVWKEDLGAAGRSVLPSGEVVEVTPAAEAEPAEAEPAAEEAPPSPDLLGIVARGKAALARFAKEDAEAAEAAEAEAEAAPTLPLGNTPPPLPSMPGVSSPAEAVAAEMRARMTEGAPIVPLAAPAPSPPSTPAALDARMAGRTAALPFATLIFVGCLPVGVGVEMSLGVLTGPFERMVEAEAGVTFYGLLPYAQGPKAVASALRSNLLAAPPAWRTIFVDPSHPCANDCLPVLSQLPGAMVIRSTGGR